MLRVKRVMPIPLARCWKAKGPDETGMVGQKAAQCAKRRQRLLQPHQIGADVSCQGHKTFALLAVSQAGRQQLPIQEAQLGDHALADGTAPDIARLKPVSQHEPG